MLTIVNGVTSKQVLANEIINLLETMGLDVQIMLKRNASSATAELLFHF